jgi:hypothetical protein
MLHRKDRCGGPIASAGFIENRGQVIGYGVIAQRDR